MPRHSSSAPMTATAASPRPRSKPDFHILLTMFASERVKRSGLKHFARSPFHRRRRDGRGGNRFKVSRDGTDFPHQDTHSPFHAALSVADLRAPVLHDLFGGVRRRLWFYRRQPVR